MKAISNAYTDFRLVNLDSGNPQRGPFAVTQRGYDPHDSRMIEQVFILRRDGTWVPETVFGTGTREERFQSIFETTGEIMKLAEQLPSEPRIERRAVSEAEMNEWISMLKTSGGMQELVRAMLSNYRAGNKT